MSKQISSRIVSLTLSILVFSFLAAFYVVAWQEPAEAPPEGNVSSPLNVSNEAQVKVGGLLLNSGGAPNGLIVDEGNLCLGDGCISAWPLRTVSGTSCPSGYSPAMRYYEPKTCAPPGSQLPCTTPAGWGVASEDPTPGGYLVTHFIAYYFSAPSVESVGIVPSCGYTNASGNKFICFPDTVSKTMCSIDNP